MRCAPCPAGLLRRDPPTRPRSTQGRVAQWPGRSPSLSDFEHLPRETWIAHTIHNRDRWSAEPTEMIIDATRPRAIRHTPSEAWWFAVHSSPESGMKLHGNCNWRLCELIKAVGPQSRGGPGNAGLEAGGGAGIRTLGGLHLTRFRERCSAVRGRAEPYVPGRPGSVLTVLTRSARRRTATETATGMAIFVPDDHRAPGRSVESCAA
jgi:hypothetical protein